MTHYDYTHIYMITYIYIYDYIDTIDRYIYMITYIYIYILIYIDIYIYIYINIFKNIDIEREREHSIGTNKLATPKWYDIPLPGPQKTFLFRNDFRTTVKVAFLSSGSNKSHMEDLGKAALGGSRTSLFFQTLHTTEEVPICILLNRRVSTDEYPLLAGFLF